LRWLRLEEALHGTDCPICFQIERTETHYLEGMLYEYVLDVGVRKKLHGEYGLCTRHAVLAVQMERKLNSDGLHLATMFETVIEESIRKLNNQVEIMKRLTEGNRKKRLVHSVYVSRCLVCHFVEETEQIISNGFLYFSSDEELINAYNSSTSILCFRHIEMLVKERVNVHIIRITLQKLEKMKVALSNFIKKHDYQSAHDYNEDELQSYLAVVRFFSGKYRA